MTDDHIYRYLDTDGDGTGTTNAIGNYSGGAEIFFIQPAAWQTFSLERMIVSLEDAGGMTAQEYGNLGSALTNGVIVRKQDDSGTILELTDGVAVKSNAQWGVVCYDVDVKGWGSGNDLLVVRWTFSRSGKPLILNGENNERLEVVLEDDLTGLLSHRFKVQGLITGGYTR